MKNGRSLPGRILREIVERLGFLQSVGLSYLTLDRSAQSLSGGESQRIRLATQIGSKLTGVLYVLDEPSIGLHQKDNQRLLKTLLKMRDLGNTVLVVEHDEETIRSADYVVDMGPGAGVNGGRVVFAGTPVKLLTHESSLTGQYLSGRKSIPIPAGRRSNRQTATHCAKAPPITILKNISVAFPLGCFNLCNRRIRIGKIQPCPGNTLSCAGSKTPPYQNPGRWPQSCSGYRTR